MKTMRRSDTNDPYPKELFENSLRCLRDQTRILSEMSEDMLRLAGNKILCAAGPIAVGAESSCKSVLLLMEHDQARDAFVCARTAFLSILNAAYIFAEGEKTAEQARRHSLQKSVRDLERLAEAGNMKFAFGWKGSVDELKQKFPEIRSAIDNFTDRRSGRERTNWSGKSEPEKIDVIARKYGDRVGGFLLIAMAAIYRHASELAHGTLFGAHWHLGFTTPGDYPETRDELNLGPRKRACSMLSALAFCVFVLIDIQSREFSDFRRFFVESNENIKQFVDQIKISE